MEIESDPLEEEQTQVYGFQHILFQQFTAGKYVATLDMASYRLRFLVSEQGLHLTPPRNR